MKVKSETQSSKLCASNAASQCPLTIFLVRLCAELLESDKETPSHVKDQIRGQLEFMETFMGWYNTLTGLPQRTLLKMMRLGQRLAKVIGA
jgi:hypothetical protein